MKSALGNIPLTHAQRQFLATQRAALNRKPADGLLAAIGRKAEGKEALGFWGEQDQEMRQRYGVSERSNTLRFDSSLPMYRDLATNANGGNYLVGTTNAGGSFIEMLRNASILDKVGAKFLRGLQGNVTIPRQTAAATAYWLANETAGITETQQTLGQLAFSPKNVGAYTEVSRQLMVQSNPACEMLVMNDLAAVLARAIDTAALSGSGSGGQPQGLIGTAGVGSVTGTSLAYAGLLEFQSDVATSNALTDGAAYLTTPTVAGLLCQRQRFTSTDSPLWSGNVAKGSVIGFDAYTSNGVPAGTMIFGDWSQLIVAEWGVIELATNPYANFQSGITGIRGWATVDIGIRQPAAFSVASSIT